MAVIKLKAGETVLVAAVDPSLYPDQGLPTPPTGPVDPGYGIDVGLGWLRPTHPIVLPPEGPPPIPTHPIVLPPPPPVDPGYGIDEDIGYVPPEGGIEVPGKPELNWELKTAWTESTGWIVVAVPTGAHATPSAKMRR